MKIAYLVACLLALGTLAFNTRSVPASGQNPSLHAVATMAQESPQAQAPQQSQTFMGKIAQADGKFVLQDNSSKATFMLDDQDKAKAYEGKNVKVIGTLDPNSNVIHVVDIQEA